MCVFFCFVLVSFFLCFVCVVFCVFGFFWCVGVYVCVLDFCSFLVFFFLFLDGFKWQVPRSWVASKGNGVAKSC